MVGDGVQGAENLCLGVGRQAGQCRDRISVSNIRVVRRSVVAKRVIRVGNVAQSGAVEEFISDELKVEAIVHSEANAAVAGAAIGPGNTWRLCMDRCEGWVSVPIADLVDRVVGLAVSGLKQPPPSRFLRIGVIKI